MASLLGNVSSENRLAFQDNFPAKQQQEVPRQSSGTSARIRLFEPKFFWFQRACCHDDNCSYEALLESVMEDTYVFGLKAAVPLLFKSTSEYSHLVSSPNVKGLFLWNTAIQVLATPRYAAINPAKTTTRTSSVLVGRKSVHSR